MSPRAAFRRKKKKSLARKGPMSAAEEEEEGRTPCRCQPRSVFHWRRRYTTRAGAGRRPGHIYIQCTRNSVTRGRPRGRKREPSRERSLYLLRQVQSCWDFTS
jgi:hypothetical protein